MGVKKEELTLDDSVKQNSKGQVILGRLSGPCADFIHPTRNGRLYDEELWEKVFSDPIVNEYFEAGGIPGELDHPADRLETCSEKIAIMMPEKPKKNADGQLIATFDILDTPNGRIAYTLAKYGYKLGISSRGNGEVIENYDGTSKVDENTYDFQGFDLVLLPAVKAARLQLESYNRNNFSKAINEALERSTADEQKVMVETLNNLNIDYKQETVIDKLEESKESSNIAANNAGASIMKDLQESLQKQKELEAQVLELQEKLSVCYAKEAKDEDDIARYKKAILNLSEKANNAKVLQSKVEALNEQLSSKTKLIESRDRLISENSNRFQTLKAKSKEMLSESAQSYEKQLAAKERELKSKDVLIEGLTNKVKEMKVKDAEISKLNENIKKLENSRSEDYKKLEESYSELEKDISLKTKNYQKKLKNLNETVEIYRKNAKEAINRYIESLSDKYGLKKDEIIRQLPENYSFEDIDSICENLANLKLKVSNLPIGFKQDNSKVILKESKKPSILPKSNTDDEVDESLLNLAGLTRTLN